MSPDTYICMLLLMLYCCRVKSCGLQGKCDIHLAITQLFGEASAEKGTKQLIDHDSDIDKEEMAHPEKKILLMHAVANSSICSMRQGPT